MNLLISTTRMWNPGDELIYLGVKHLLERYFGWFNPVLWNRYPGVRSRPPFGHAVNPKIHCDALSQPAYHRRMPQGTHGQTGRIGATSHALW